MKSGSNAAHSQKTYDVFNGDADGICALHQLRLAYPKDAILVTGVKREIDLLQRVPIEPQLDVTVLDISLDVNVDALKRILDAGGQVDYFDHHAAQKAFEHSGLQLHWNDSPDVCTSLLVNHYLRGRHQQWAVTAAFGDNLLGVGRALAKEAGLSSSEAIALEQLGVTLNYNAYGESIEDLHVAPEKLYRALHEFVSPLDFIATSSQYRLLIDGYRTDEAKMTDLRSYWQDARGAVYILPNAPWARRVSGIFANRLVANDEKLSYAVLTEKTDGSYVVSVRSSNPEEKSANGFCGQFSTGGGRRLAAGINSLPATDIDQFIGRFADYFSTHGSAQSTQSTDRAHEH